MKIGDNKVIRSRRVYDLITMIAEMSGFADIFMVTAGFYFGIFHH
jgi:hypothetical protein